jgi:hypothetical protein
VKEGICLREDLGKLKGDWIRVEIPRYTGRPGLVRLSDVRKILELETRELLSISEGFTFGSI